MNGFDSGMRKVRPRTGNGPPGCDRVVAAFRSSARLLLGVAFFVGACGLVAVAAGLLRPAGDGALLLILLGAFLLALSLVPLLLGLRRRQRVLFLAGLRERWGNLARAGDPHEQIAPLARAYAGIVGNDLRLRVP